jgi:drug/metabolite transporter (DMT)-like permease
MLALLLLSASIGAGVSLYGKKTIDKGLSAKKFIFIQTFSMIAINGILFLFYPFELVISATTLGLIFSNAILRIISVTIGADNLKYLSALEFSAFSSLAIFVTYLIDTVIGSNQFTILGAVSILFVIIGSVLLAKGRIPFDKVGWKMLMRILCNVLRGYITYFALKQIGNVTFIFVTFVASGLLLLPFMKYFTKEKITKADWKFSFTSQTFSLVSFIAGNILAKESATHYMLVRPANMVLLLFFTYAISKYKKQNLNLLQIIGAVVILGGIVLFTLNKF